MTSQVTIQRFRNELVSEKLHCDATIQQLRNQLISELLCVSLPLIHNSLSVSISLSLLHHTVHYYTIVEALMNQLQS